MLNLIEEPKIVEELLKEFYQNMDDLEDFLKRILKL
jgi:hypothetical protein